MESQPCPVCKCAYAYSDGVQLVCPDCGNEWMPGTEAAEAETATSLVVKDSNGNVLQNGDTIVVIKNLPVKGMAHPIKAGTKVKNIRLVEGDHNIDCKVDGFGSMTLKSEFVKKA